jgi:hypothetical protein
LLRVLGSGSLAAVLAHFGQAEADAKPKRRCRRRRKLGQRCEFRNGVKCRCRFGAKCIGGFCRCPHGTIEAHGVCIPPPDTCLEHGAVCSGSDSCCSGFCTYEGPLDEVEPTCCVPNAETCSQASDCCADADDPARCQFGRCCRDEGGLCADPTGHQFDTCCNGLVCDVTDTHRCVELGVTIP